MKALIFLFSFIFQGPSVPVQHSYFTTRTSRLGTVQVHVNPKYVSLSGLVLSPFFPPLLFSSPSCPHSLFSHELLQYASLYDRCEPDENSDTLHTQEASRLQLKGDPTALPPSSITDTLHLRPLVQCCGSVVSIGSGTSLAATVPHNPAPSDSELCPFVL